MIFHIEQRLLWSGGGSGSGQADRGLDSGGDRRGPALHIFRPLGFHHDAGLGLGARVTEHYAS